tara:strand:- start:232 stop:648 length:417 start_codon:yes stop_codon:yes gene_type:complete
MKYVKHYWVDAVSNAWLTTTNDPSPVRNGKIHPYNVFPPNELDVKIWLTDSDDIDVCLSELPDSFTIEEVIDGSKKAVVELTETQFNTVKTPYDAAGVLREEAHTLRTQETPDETAAAAKDTEADTKIAEAKTALNAL